MLGFVYGEAIDGWGRTDHMLGRGGCEVVPRPYEICDWLLNSSRDHFSFHQGKHVKSDK